MGEKLFLFSLIYSFTEKFWFCSFFKSLPYSTFSLRFRILPTSVRDQINWLKWWAVSCPSFISPPPLFFLNSGWVKKWVMVVSYGWGHLSSWKKYKLPLTFTNQREYWNTEKLFVPPVFHWEHFVGNQDTPTLQNFSFLHSYLFLLRLPFKFVIWHLELFLLRVWPFLFSVFWL